MNEYLRERILRKLENLSDERAYQVLDYVDFLETKYAERQSAQQQNVFQRFADSVEGRLRAGQISATTVAETMKYMNRAMGVLTGVAAAGRSVASDIVDAARRQAATGPAASGSGTTGATGSTGATAAPDTAAPPVTPTPSEPASTSTPSASAMTTPTTPMPTPDGGSGEQPL